MKVENYHLEKLNGCHAVPVMAIFNHYIENGHAAFFEQTLPDSFYERLLALSAGYPAVAVKEGDTVIGFAFLRSYHPALGQSAEATYFIHPDHTRRGIGKMLLEHLRKEAEAMGIKTIIASISSLNPESIAFHERNGFREAGRLRSMGSKLGKEFDVVYMQG